MSDMFLEIIEMEGGEIALRRADSQDEPIMRIAFSADVKQQLQERSIDVANVMLTTGIQMISEINVKQAAEKCVPPADESVSALEEGDASGVIH